MPQMSPLMWVILMIFFTTLYLGLGLVIYYEHYLSQSDKSNIELNLSGNFIILF